MSGYRTWDREEKLGPPPWSPDDPKVIAWERAHGHDVRLKCYPEFGCQLLEAESIELFHQFGTQLLALQKAALAALDWIEGESEGAPSWVGEQEMRRYDKERDTISAALRAALNPAADEGER